MPPSMLDDPANAAWPPPLTENGHCVRRDIRTAVETSKGFVGAKTHLGLTEFCCADQYTPVKFL